MFVCRRLRMYAVRPLSRRAQRALGSQSERDEDGVGSDFEHGVSVHVSVSLVLPLT
jgi:hypothetical protein